MRDERFVSPAPPATPRERELLEVLAEECAEVAQRCMKALRFGPTEVQPGQDLTNFQRVAEEVGDVFGTVALMCQERMLSNLEIRAAQAAKLAKLRRFLQTVPVDEELAAMGVTGPVIDLDDPAPEPQDRVVTTGLGTCVVPAAEAEREDAAMRAQLEQMREGLDNGR